MRPGTCSRRKGLRCSAPAMAFSVWPAWACCVVFGRVAGNRCAGALRIAVGGLTCMRGRELVRMILWRWGRLSVAHVVGFFAAE